MKAQAERQTGFTIVELLIVIVVIAILAAITVVAYNGMQTRAKVSRSASDLKNISQAVVMYHTEQGQVPCFDHNWIDTTEAAWVSKYMSWPRNPSGGRYHWEHGTVGASISIESPGLELAQGLDDKMDDGNLSTGLIRGSGSRLEYYNFQSIYPSLSHGDDC